MSVIRPLRGPYAFRALADRPRGPGRENVAQRRSALGKPPRVFVPLLAIAYLFKSLDRASLGFAALAMNQQHGQSAGRFGFCRDELPVTMPYSFPDQRRECDFLVT